MSTHRIDLNRRITVLTYYGRITAWNDINQTGYIFYYDPLIGNERSIRFELEDINASLAKMHLLKHSPPALNLVHFDHGRLVCFDVELNNEDHGRLWPQKAFDIRSSRYFSMAEQMRANIAASKQFSRAPRHFPYEDAAYSNEDDDWWTDYPPASGYQNYQNRRFFRGKSPLKKLLRRSITEGILNGS